MSFATREQFLAPAKRRFKDVDLPVCGLKVRIRSLMEGEKEAYEAVLLNDKSGGLRSDKLRNARRRLIAICLVDGNGDLMLNAKDDLETLKSLDGADMAVLQEECMVHCGFKAGDIEGLVKNSETVHVEG